MRPWSWNGSAAESRASTRNGEITSSRGIRWPTIERPADSGSESLGMIGPQRAVARVSMTQLPARPFARFSAPIV
jgi:hypothetical protein